MRLMSTAEKPYRDPIGKFVSREHTVGLDHLSLAVLIHLVGSMALNVWCEF
jgi:hypothetical protein